MDLTHRHRTTSVLLLESALIVASILLAFALNGWWETRQDRSLAEQALISFEREISQNRANVLDVMPYHDRLEHGHRDGSAQPHSIRPGLG